MCAARPAGGGALFVGVDGGGTRCRARIEDASGRVLGRGLAGPATVRLGMDGSLAAIHAACRAALDDAGLPPAAMGALYAGIGLAGICRKGALAELSRRPQPFRGVAYRGDAEIACIGAHGGRDGGIVTVGTGSIGLAIIAGRTLRVGGWGFPVSDEGSGADLGLEALRTALRAFDGRAEPTALAREVMARFGGDPVEVIAWLDRATATDYAALAPVVVRLAAQGDGAARRILDDAAAHIGTLVRRLIAWGAERVSLVGGLSAAIEPRLAANVRRRLAPPLGDAVDGALHLARGLASRRNAHAAPAVSWRS